MMEKLRFESKENNGYRAGYLDTDGSNNSHVEMLDTGKHFFNSIELKENNISDSDNGSSNITDVKVEEIGDGNTGSSSTTDVATAMDDTGDNETVDSKLIVKERNETGYQKTPDSNTTNGKVQNIVKISKDIDIKNSFST